MNDRIRQRARELGFDDCRITSADPPARAAYFEAWLAAGRQGAMSYLERQAARRADPQRVLPGARSIVVLAASYHRPADEESSPGDLSGAARGGPPSALVRHGGVARYACHADYHDVLLPRIHGLMEFLRELGGAATESRGYVDTGPVMERELAERAGLGFVGKHTNLISRRLGNWFLIAEILTTLELVPDPGERNHCGSCRRCLDACPTQAIVAPFELDARLCIAYLTIEFKGSIPEALRPAIGSRVFGCDDCLEACPWNRFAREGRLLREHRRDDLRAPHLVDLLTVDEAEFRRRFAGTPLERTRRRGLRRNACVALGNVGDADALPALAQAASDPEPLVAEHARWAMGQIEGRLDRRSIPT